MISIFLWARLKLFVEFLAYLSCMNDSKEIILCLRLELWPVTEETANMTQMFSATSVFLLVKIIITNQILCFHWSQHLFFAIIQKPMEKSHWVFCQGNILVHLQKHFCRWTSTLLEENSTVKGKNMAEFCLLQQTQVIVVEVWLMLCLLSVTLTVTRVFWEHYGVLVMGNQNGL